MPLDATPGGATSNSYATAAEGDAYHVNHLYASAWNAATTPTKEAALIWATRLLDEQVEWKAQKINILQALRWPRWGVLDPDGLPITGAIIPTFLKNATSEMARYLIQEDRTVERAIGLKSVTADVVRVDFDKSDLKPILPPSVVSLIAPYGRLKGAGSGWAKLERV